MPDRGKPAKTISVSFMKCRLDCYIGIAFAVAIIYLWLEELLDLPHYILGTAATPINWAECALETVAFTVLGLAVVLIARQLLRRLRYLEGFLPVCSFCKRIRVGDDWIPFEEYLHEYSSVGFTHSLCPDCAKQHYGYDETKQKRE